MSFSVGDILRWTGTNGKDKKFIEGKRLVRHGHVLRCGGNIKNGLTVVSALCQNTDDYEPDDGADELENLQNELEPPTPHDQLIEINSEGITRCFCSCREGFEEKCRHIIAALLYCYINISEREMFTGSEDSSNFDNIMKIFTEDPKPIMEYEYFAKMKSEVEDEEEDEEDKEDEEDEEDEEEEE